MTLSTPLLPGAGMHCPNWPVAKSCICVWKWPSDPYATGLINKDTAWNTTDGEKTFTVLASDEFSRRTLTTPEAT